MRSSVTEVETGRERLELEAWQVRMEPRSSLARGARVSRLVTRPPAPTSSTWKELSTTWFSLTQRLERGGDWTRLTSTR
jgi:hypothetical protein